MINRDISAVDMQIVTSTVHLVARTRTGSILGANTIPEVDGGEWIRMSPGPNVVTVNLIVVNVLEQIVLSVMARCA